MDNSYLVENRKATARLRNLVKNVSADELKLKLNKEGWTVAVALAHLAFYDQRRIILFGKWKKTGVTASPNDTDVFNDAMIPLFLAIPPGKAAKLAVSVAEETDRVIEGLKPALVEAIAASKDTHALNRANHRNQHLDQIDKLLKTHRKP